MTTLEQLLQPKTKTLKPRTDPRVNIELPESMKADLVSYVKTHNTTISRVIRAMISLHMYPELADSPAEPK